MFISNKTKLALVVGVSMFASTSFAQTENTTATLTLSSAFTLAETAPLTFGTIRASQVITAATNGDNGIPTIDFAAGVKVNSDGSAPTELNQGTTTQTGTGGTDGTVVSQVTVIAAGAPGTYTIAGAAPNTNLRILPVTAIELTNGSVTDATSKFDLAIDVTTDVRIVGGTNDGALYTTATPNLRTDGTGAVGITVGGSLRIDPLAESVEEGVYTGDYSLTVSY